jgi:hypothetical protein
VISDEGGRVFFNSGEPLVPGATNGWLDVYEWERDGTGSCQENAGCVYLLGSGTDSENSYLIGADATGANVFFVSRAQLVPSDRNDLDDLYDARVGAVQPPAPPACSGTGCQGVPPAPPIFEAPASATITGTDDLPPPTPVVVKKATKKTLKCAKGKTRNKHAKCVPKKKKHTKAKKTSHGKGRA